MSEKKRKCDFQLVLSISEFEINRINNDTAVVFKIDLMSMITNKDWTVTRTLADCKGLHKSLLKGFLNVAEFPNTDRINLSQFDLNVLRLSIEDYMKDLIQRPDLINSLQLKNFLELENHLTDYMSAYPLLLNEIADSSAMEVTDIIFSKEESLIFAGFAYSSATGGISSYLTSLSSLWSSSNLGELSIYHMVTSNYGEIHTNRIFNQTFTSQVARLKYVEGENLDILTVGLFDGTVLMFKIYLNTKTYVSKNLVDLMCKVRPHRNKIIDMGIEHSVGYLYTAALNEKSIVISETNYEKVIESFVVSDSTITNFFYEKDNKRIFVTDAAGSLWILHVENYINIRKVQAVHCQLPGISCLKVEPDRNFIFIGTNNGMVRFFDYDDLLRRSSFKSSPGTSDSNLNPNVSLKNIGMNISIHQKFDIVLDRKLNVKVNDIKFRPCKSALILALSNGSIGFWSHDEFTPEFVLDCHEKSVKRIIYDEIAKILITCSSDKTIKIWHLPQFWPSELMRSDKEFNERSIIEEHTSNQNNIKKIQNALRNLDFREEGEEGEHVPEGDYFNQNDLPEEEKVEVEAEEEVKTAQTVQSLSPFSIAFQKEESTENTLQKDNTQKEVNAQLEDEGLIDKNYMYDEHQDDTFLDGWDNDAPLEKPNKLIDIYSFIGGYKY